MWRDCPFGIVNYISNNRLYAVTNIAGQEIINHNVPPSGPNRVKSKYNYHHDVGVLWNLSKVSSHNSFYIAYIVPIVFFGLVRLYVLELGYIFVDLFWFLGILVETILLWHPLLIFKWSPLQETVTTNNNMETTFSIVRTPIAFPMEVSLPKTLLLSKLMMVVLIKNLLGR